MTVVRLNKYLAHTFGLSRREADQRIEQGRVLVNGKVVMLGKTIDPAQDKISFDNQIVAQTPMPYTYLLLNKPVGYVCSRKQQDDAPTVYTLLPKKFWHLKVAGRLDKDSCGLILLTNDGDAIFKLTHPKFGKEKVYHVGLNKPLAPQDSRNLLTGIDLEDGKSTLVVTPLKEVRRPNMYKVVMSEGRNRQIRRTFKALGYSVTHLERIGFGPYALKGLGTAQYLQITD